MPGLDALGRALVALGAGVALMGLLLLGLGRLLGGGGLLPGDVVIRRPGFVLVLPIVTSLVISVILTGIMWLLLSAGRR